MRGNLKVGRTVKVRDGKGVRGTVPQSIRLDAEDGVRLMFRPDAVYKNATVRVLCGEREIAKRRQMIFTPGEMAVIDLKKEIVKGLDADLTVEVG